MAVSPTPPLISALPPAPLPTDAEAIFDAKAGARLTAEEVMVAEVNIVVSWMNGVLIDTQSVAANAEAAARSETAASEASASAQVYAAAAQSALGIPAMAGKAGMSLMVNAGETAPYWGSTFPAYSGNGGKFLQLNTAGTALQWTKLGSLHAVDEKPSGTSAGDSVAGSYVTRELNTLRNNGISGASLSANAITLPPGTYRIRGRSSVGVSATQNKTRLFNVTGGTVIALGQAETSTGSQVFAETTLSVTSVIRLEQRQAIARTGGLGTAASFGDVEVYSEMIIEKVA